MYNEHDSLTFEHKKTPETEWDDVKITPITRLILLSALGDFLL